MTAEIPLFPLRTVLFPGGWLPLRIFEPRYLDMVQRCEAAGEAFGVVSLTEGREVREREGGGFKAEAFQEVGTLALIERFERQQPGLIVIHARGTERFRLASSRCLSHGLWVGEARLLPPDATVAVPEDLRIAARQLQDLLAQWRSGASEGTSEGAAESELPLQPPYRWDDAGWLANRWAELLPMPPLERQRLMMVDNPLLRLELVVDRLDAISR